VVLKETQEGALGGVGLEGPPFSRSMCVPSCHQLGGESLNVWVLDPAHGDVELAASYLDRDEARRAAMLQRPGDRANYVVAHAALRQLLGHYLDLAPADVVYTREGCPRCGGPNGRPVVDRSPPGLHFSLSRRGHVILIGIATAPVGVDVEVVGRPDVAGQVAELLHPAERAELSAATPSERSMVFTRLWTRKEAYLKGVGVGVAHGLALEYLGYEGRAAAPSDWSVLEVPVPGPYVAAAAVRTGPVSPAR
jgi:4'-phosphopantetheinyl transferase